MMCTPYETPLWKAIFGEEDYELAEAMWLTGADLNSKNKKISWSLEPLALIDIAVRWFLESPTDRRHRTLLIWLLIHGACVPKAHQNDPLILEITPSDLNTQVQENFKKREQKQAALRKEKRQEGQKQHKFASAVTAQCIARIAPNHDATSLKSRLPTNVLSLITNMSQIQTGD